MVSTTTSATEMKKIKVETSTTQEPHEIEYVDVELFSEDEEIRKCSKLKTLQARQNMKFKSYNDFLKFINFYTTYILTPIFHLTP